MRANDALTHGQPEPASPFPLGEERFENTLRVRGVDSGPRIHDLDLVRIASHLADNPN